jgi:cytochrome b559 alpha subunit
MTHMLPWGVGCWFQTRICYWVIDSIIIPALFIAGWLFVGAG